MRTFRRFLHESKVKQKLNGIGFIPIEDFVTEALLEAAPFLGTTPRPLSPQQMKDYLQRVTTKTKGSKDKYEFPYIHKSNITITNEQGTEFDLDTLRRDIMTRPKTLLKQNEKMKHSDGSATQYYNIGLPALKGLAVNEATGDFVIVDTCPGAGLCKVYCFAMKGGYVQWKASSMGQTRILNYLMNDPNGFANQLNRELQQLTTKYTKKNVQLAIRWHDAGDFFSPDYVQLAYEIVRQHPTIEFYAYTKMATVATSQKPDNFLINFSAGAKPSEEKQVDLTKTKNSRVVPKSLFADLVTREVETDLIQIDTKKKSAKSTMRVKSAEHLHTLKSRLAEKFHLNPDEILSYDEMLQIPKGSQPKWHVIVMPGQGDESANRKDVLSTLLLFH